MTDREALKLALEALDEFVHHGKFEGWHKVLNAGRKVLAQPAQEPVAWTELTRSGQIAYFDGYPVFMPGKVGNASHPDPLYTTPPAALPAQEPVASIYISQSGEREFDDWKCKLPIGRNLLYPAPPQRPWVGLTDEEMYEAVRPLLHTDLVARVLVEISKDEYQAIEAALKEKNHD